MKNASHIHSTTSGLGAPAPIPAPMRKGRVVRVPEHWNGALSGAPFEAILQPDGQILLGVGVSCRYNRVKPGALWIMCPDGKAVLERARILDAALALATAKDFSKSLPAENLLEALIWLEAGAQRNGHPLGVWGAGARSLFSETARALKKGLKGHLNPHLLSLAEPSPSALRD